jgi:inner membrane protein
LDNVTHALAGMLLAEAVCVYRGETRQPVRAAAYLVSALANNLPDIDVFYSSWMEPRPLGSLLNHRGHTHTLLLALPLAWLLGWGAWRWFLRKHPESGKRESRLFLGLSLIGVVLHLGMDFGNNYGVHPFWPLNNRWFYGDSIFIVEPLWLAFAIPIVASRLQRRWLKLVLWAVLGAVLVVCWFVPFVPTPSRVLVLGVTGLAFWVAHRASERLRIGFALGGCLAVALVFVGCSIAAKAELRRATEAAFPALEVHDIAATPMPANPLCWEGLLAGEQGGSYRVLRASVALGPMAALDCNAGADVEPTASVARITRANRGGVHWLTEYHFDIAALSRLRHDDCRFRGLLEFARLPYVSASGTLAGDLRYDRKPELDFSDIELPKDPHVGGCPRFLPGWTEPRARLFQH